MLAHFVEAEAPRLAIGVASLVADHPEVVVAILDGDVVEARVAVVASGADERMQRHRRPAIAARVLLDETLYRQRKLALDHGLRLAGRRVGCAACGRALSVSARPGTCGSR